MISGLWRELRQKLSVNAGLLAKLLRWGETGITHDMGWLQLRQSQSALSLPGSSLAAGSCLACQGLTVGPYVDAACSDLSNRHHSFQGTLVASGIHRILKAR